MNLPETMISTLFSSLTGQPPWLDFLQELEHYLDGHHATMVLRRPRLGDPGVLISTQSNTAALILLQQSLFQESPFLDLPNDEICILSEMMSKRELATLHGRFYTYIQDYGAAEDLLGINLEEPETGMIFRLRCARLRGQPAFTEEDRHRLAVLVPWLRTAINLYARLARRKYQLSLADVTEEHLAIGSLLLGERGQVLITNPVSELVLQNADGLLLGKEGLLRCSMHEDHRRLQASLNRLKREETLQTVESIQIARPDGRSWSLLLRRILPQPGIEETASATTLLLFRDPAGTREISERLLMELFGLTKAEAMLVRRLVEGDSLTEAAERLGRSRHTARVQLATVFSKTGVNRQAQLIIEVLRTVQQMWALPDREDGDKD